MVERIQVKDQKELDRLLKKPRQRQTAKEMGVTEAWVQDIEKRLKNLEKFNKSLASRLDKLDEYWAAKMQEEMRGQ